MKSAIAATMAVAAGLFVANMLGVAVAEAPTGTPLRTVSVEGVATVPIGQGSSAAAATEAYRQGMAAAVADGQSKASFLAGKVGATIGGVQSVAEGGGDINCIGSESGYVGYEGEQPDFGYAQQPGVVASRSAAGAAPKPAAKHKKRKHPTAKKAATPASCTLDAQVSLVYTIG